MINDSIHYAQTALEQRGGAPDSIMGGQRRLPREEPFYIEGRMGEEGLMHRHG